MALPTRHMADVSSNNDHYYPTEYRQAGHTRTAIKATESADYANPYLVPWAQSTHSLGMAVSYYHFCRPGGGGYVYEVNHFWRHVEPLWLPGDTLHLDLEVGLQRSNPHDLAAYHNAACAYLLKVSGHDSITYMNLNYYEVLGEQLRTSYDEYWIAAYGGKEPQLGKGHKLWGWQFTDGTLGPEPHGAAGVGTCDLSLVNRRTVLADALRAPGTRRRAASKRG